MENKEPILVVKDLKQHFKINCKSGRWYFL